MANKFNIAINIRYKLSLALRQLIGENNRFYRWREWNNQKQEAVEVLYSYMGNAVSDEQRHLILGHMKQALIKNGWSFEEFFTYDWLKKNTTQRNYMVGEYEKNVWTQKVNGVTGVGILSNKYNTYQHLRRFFHREVELIKGVEDDSKFESWVSKYSEFIIKPIDGSLGQGIKKYKSSDCSLSLLLKEYPKGFILEELIVQHPELSRLHPASVNTLRIHTFRTKNGILVLHPYLRIGRGNNIVDNAAAGGILTRIDASTGVITDAVDERLHTFSTHPDSGVNLIGFEIPSFHEAFDFAEQLAMVVPECKYVGWDLALTERGWVLIEGNSKAQFLFQIPRKEGFRKEFEFIKKDM